MKVTIETIREFFTVVSFLGNAVAVQGKAISKKAFDTFTVDLKKIMGVKQGQHYDYEASARSLVYASALAKKAGGEVKLFKQGTWIWIGVTPPKDSDETKVKQTFYKLLTAKMESEAEKGTPLALYYSSKRSGFYITGKVPEVKKAEEESVDIVLEGSKKKAAKATKQAAKKPTMLDSYEALLA